ncbi:MAG: purine-nucleoside phosphorylase [Deltaproteobacteria bacterium RIFOXYD12_FULL_57_12]|nr:MAG: purine-nucleoside phosphorylase [Deltaproteobacteria bacterium RIFOXYD12_FULL_57_12]
MIDMREYKKQVDESVAFLAARLLLRPRVGLVLGTGLGALAEQLEDAIILPYEEIPHFPRATVTSHAGNLVSGRLNGQAVAMLQGRFHYYEGYSARELTFPVRVLSRLGIEILVVTNAAGGLNPAFSAGTIMVIRDHLNFIPDNPLRGPNIDEWGPRFPDLSVPYAPRLIDRTLAGAARLGIPHVETGVYVGIPGPSLETPAETRFLRSCGADAVGMSSVPEVIVARHAGLEVLGLSVVANVNDPDNFAPILIDDIISKAKEIEPRFLQLVAEVVRSI